jgi:hypothetical protein
MALTVVIANVIAPVMPAFATDQGTYQPVWCHLTGNDWKAQLGAQPSGGRNETFALLMTQSIKDDTRLDNVDKSIALNSQVMAHDRSHKLDTYCTQQAPTPATTIPAPVKPVPTPATCDADGSLTLLDTADYTWSTNPATNGNIGPGTYQITATIRNGVNKIFDNQMKTVTFDHVVVPAQLSGQACPPAPKTTYTDWSYGKVDCSILKAVQTRYKIVTPYVWIGWKWVLDPNPLHSTVTKETQLRDLTSFERMSCTPKPKDTVVYGEWTNGTFKCGDTTVERSREITTTRYTWNGTEWVANTTTTTEHKSRPATTEEQMSCVTQTQPTCETDGTLTLPAYKGEWHKDYKYVVTIGLQVKTYDADKTVTITGIPQGAHVIVKLVSDDDCFHKVIYTKEYDFDFADCITIPEQPQTNDQCGPANAFWIIPADTNEIHWSVNADGHLIATAIGGHFANGQTTIDYGVAEDSNEPCPPTSVTPVKPQITDCTFILPITLGITYTKVYLDANGNIVDPNQPGVIVAHEGVLATANPGYVLTPGNDGGKWINNGSYLYTLDLTGLNCGGGSVTPPVVTPPTVTPPAVAPVSANLPTPAELPHTGSSLSGLLVTFLATLTTYGVVYFLQPKRR